MSRRKLIDIIDLVLPILWVIVSLIFVFLGGHTLAAVYGVGAMIYLKLNRL